jgi:hypothetical protein
MCKKNGLTVFLHSQLDFQIDATETAWQKFCVEKRKKSLLVTFACYSPCYLFFGEKYPTKSSPLYPLAFQQSFDVFFLGGYSVGQASIKLLLC